MTRAVRSAPTRRATARRAGIVYVYETRRVDRRGMPADGVEVGYVGQTRQALEQRDAQHRGRRPNRNGHLCPQPWSDLIVSVRVAERGVWDDARLDGREAHWIGSLRPRWNWELNDGPHRIGILEARAMRDVRDRAAGVVPRQWAPLRGAFPVVTSRRRDRRMLVPVCVGVALWVGLWIALAVAGHALGIPTPPELVAPLAAVAASLIVGRVVRRR